MARLEERIGDMNSYDFVESMISALEGRKYWGLVRKFENSRIFSGRYPYTKNEFVDSIDLWMNQVAGIERTDAYRIRDINKEPLKLGLHGALALGEPSQRVREIFQGVGDPWELFYFLVGCTIKDNHKRRDLKPFNYDDKDLPQILWDRMKIGVNEVYKIYGRKHAEGEWDREGWNAQEDTFRLPRARDFYVERRPEISKTRQEMIYEKFIELVAAEASTEGDMGLGRRVMKDQFLQRLSHENRAYLTDRVGEKAMGRFAVKIKRPQPKGQLDLF